MDDVYDDEDIDRANSFYLMNVHRQPLKCATLFSTVTLAFLEQFLQFWYLCEWERIFHRLLTYNSLAHFQLSDSWCRKVSSSC